MARDNSDIIKGPSLADRARDKLRAAILEGDLKPGEKINIERVAETFGISRTPIREALKALETEGMVQLQPNRGAIVEPQAWQEIQHRFRMRSLLEGYAAELACERRDPELVSFLQQNCSQVRAQCNRSQAVSPSRARKIADLNRSFHRAIWEASDSRTLVRFLEALDLPQSFSDSIYLEESSRDLVLQEHQAIVDAFLSGDNEKARELMSGHIQMSGSLLATAAHSPARVMCG